MAITALRRIWRNPFVGAVGAVTIALIVNLAVRSRVKPIDAVMLVLLAVVVLAARYRRGPALLAVALSVALFDFFFVPPYNTFAVLDQSYLFTFAVMLVVALIMSRLTGTIREQTIAAQHREQRASALYEMIRELARTESRDRRLAIAAEHLGRIVQGTAAIAILDEVNPKETAPTWPEGPPLADLEIRVAATWAYQHDQSVGWGTNRSVMADATLFQTRDELAPSYSSLWHPGATNVERRGFAALLSLAHRFAFAFTEFNATARGMVMAWRVGSASGASPSRALAASPLLG